jgi:hypothetical protein
MKVGSRSAGASDTSGKIPPTRGSARFIESAHGLAVEAPLLRASLQKFRVGHDFD